MNEDSVTTDKFFKFKMSFFVGTLKWFSAVPTKIVPSWLVITKMYTPVHQSVSAERCELTWICLERGLTLRSGCRWPFKTLAVAVVTNRKYRVTCRVESFTVVFCLWPTETADRRTAVSTEWTQVTGSSCWFGPLTLTHLLPTQLAPVRAVS